MEKEKVIEVLEDMISLLEGELSHVQSGRIVYDNLDDLKDYIISNLNDYVDMVNE